VTEYLSNSRFVPLLRWVIAKKERNDERRKHADEYCIRHMKKRKKESKCPWNQKIRGETKCDKGNSMGTVDLIPPLRWQLIAPLTFLPGDVKIPVL